MEIVLLVMVLAGALGLEVWIECRRKKRFRNLMRKMEELSKENKYIDAYTGKVRECPIGIYIKNGEGHFLYASSHPFEDVKKLLEQGCKVT